MFSPKFFRKDTHYSLNHTFIQLNKRKQETMDLEIDCAKDVSILSVSPCCSLFKKAFTFSVPKLFDEILIFRMKPAHEKKLLSIILFRTP